MPRCPMRPVRPELYVSEWQIVNGNDRTNAMGILFDATILKRRKIVVDHVPNVLDVDATRSDSGSDQNGCVARPEGTHSSLALLLGAVTMHGRDRQMHVEQEIVEVVSGLTAVDKDDRTDAVHLLEQSDQKLSLLMRFGLENDLSDVGTSATSTTNTEADVRRSQVGLREIARRLRKCSREQAEFDVALVLLYDDG